MAGATGIYFDALDRGIHPSDMEIDDELVSLGLAEYIEGLIELSGKLPVQYYDPERLEPEEVKEVLMDGEYDDDAGA